MKRALVCGAGGFIGSHMVRRLKSEGYWVRGVDLKFPSFSTSVADEFIIGDLRDVHFCKASLIISSEFRQFDEVYQFAADMGGAGYVFTGEHDLDIMHNSAMINLNMVSLASFYKKIFYSSSACMYPEHNQMDPLNPKCSEGSAYPANPDSEYGWEKLFSERLYLANKRNYKVDCKIARFHNIFGPEGTWEGGKEKSPAAFCRKIIEADKVMKMWGNGIQTRSYLYIDECIEGVRRLMDSDLTGPYNIGSEEMVSMNDFAKMIMGIENKDLIIEHIDGPTGVRGRNSDNTLIKKDLNWSPSLPLIDGITNTYFWIKDQINKKK